MRIAVLLKGDAEEFGRRAIKAALGHEGAHVELVSLEAHPATELVDEGLSQGAHATGSLDSALPASSALTDLITNEGFDLVIAGFADEHALLNTVATQLDWPLRTGDLTVPISTNALPAILSLGNAPTTPKAPSAPAAPKPPQAPTPPTAAPAAPAAPQAPTPPAAPQPPTAPTPPTPPAAPAPPAPPQAPTAPQSPAAPQPPSAPTAPTPPAAPAAPTPPAPPAAPTAPSAPAAPQPPAASTPAPAVENKNKASNDSNGKAGRNKATPSKQPEPQEPKRFGRFTAKQWIGGAILGFLGLAAILALAVMSTRYFLLTNAGSTFINNYDGHSPLPEGTPVGLPVWVNILHFFNAFFLILIVRTGLQVRYERKPSAFFSPKWKPQAKSSLILWFHLALDVLWILNGLIFFILLFATGHWVRLVPTTWEVFPNALSAGLQYLSLDWPVENGWVNYNALQQLTYFFTVFIAAPLSILSGLRLSVFWPSKPTWASKVVPTQVARKMHFPLMLYFVAFTVVHVALVFATGALRNLNHIFAGQGSSDPAAYADNWMGFVIFLIALSIIAAAWIAARPVVLAPLARLFGKVTAR